jgi:hypothetical protein
MCAASPRPDQSLAHEFVYESSDDAKRRRDDAQEWPVVLAAGEGVAAIAPKPTAGAGDAMLLLDRFAVFA